jgi:hypothetical protein
MSDATSDRIIVQQLRGHWSAWWEHEPQISFGGVTPAEAVDRNSAPFVVSNPGDVPPIPRPVIAQD